MKRKHISNIDAVEPRLRGANDVILEGERMK